MTMLNKEWEVNVLSMAKHKLLEKMEYLNKEEFLSDIEIDTYKDCVKALYYIMSIEKAMQ